MKFSPNPQLVSKWIDEELILLDQAAGRVHKLNGTAAAIFELCDGATEKDAILRKLKDIYQADRGVLAQDMESILRQFLELGLVSEV